MNFGMNQFYTDLEIANKTELEVANLFKQVYRAEVLEVNDDYRYDLKLKEPEGKEFTVEIKEDFTCARTGNLGIEYSCRGKDSGITRTQADFYLIKAHRPTIHEYIMISVKRLKELITQKKYHRTVNGGDPGSNSLNYLFRLETIKEAGKHIFKGM